jgi:hypothetical protein
MTRFWNNRLQGAQSRKIGKPNNFKFWEQVNQRPRHDLQNRERPPMPEGGEPYF